MDACRNMGINVPILPGIMCISTYGGFKVRKVIGNRQVEWGRRILDKNNEVCLHRREAHMLMRW